MGKLQPGITVNYKTENGIIYATQAGVESKVEVGYKHDPRTADGRPLVDHIRDDQLWNNIRKKAQIHPGLQAELERVIMFYNLIKTEKKTTDIMWHPV